MKTAIVALAKKESRYVDEWLDYHTKLGFTKIFLINNDNLDDNSLADMADELMNKYPVQIMNLRGYDALKIAGMQKGVYNNVYNEMIKPAGFDWVTFIDLDEFLWFDGKSVEEYLSQPMFVDTDVIHLNWRVYGDNGNMLYEDKPVLERFSEQAPLLAKYNGDEIEKGITENMFVKSILRVSDKRLFIDVHTCYVENGICRRSNGMPSDCRWSAEQVSTDVNYVRHYITKSLQEYIDRRCVEVSDAAHYITPVEKRIAWYFNLNEKTPEKVAYVKERLGLEV